MATATVSVRVQPRSRRDEVVGRRGEAVLVRVVAPALEDRANEALCRVLAQRLGVRPASVTILRGRRSRDKLVRIDGLDQAAVDTALGG